jgi:hypothetical protein
MMHRAAVLAVSCFTAITLFGSSCRAQVQPRSSNLKCRNHIGSSAQRLVTRGLRLVDDCYDQGPSPRPCAQVQKLRPGPFLGAPAAFALAETFTAGITNAWCIQETDILANYPAAKRGSGTINLVGTQAQILINASAATLQGPISPGGKGRSARKTRRCIRAIGEVRTKIVRQVLGQAIRCQRSIDRTASSFGIISPTCLGPARKVSQRSKAIDRACAGFAGPDIGSCGPLPDCVVASATQTGHDLAVATYGARPEQQGLLCGNGVIDAGETCDDGSANSPTGTCTDQCQKARCGDDRVEAGVEQCDPGSQGKDSSNPKTNDPDCNSDCMLTTCGDGVLYTGTKRSPEQCDDGDKNGTPGDQCTSTCQFVTVGCPGGSTIDVTMTFVSDSSTFSSGNVAGIDLQVAYPPSVSFPGSQDIPVDDPTDPATRIVLLGGPYDLYDAGALINFFDYDTSIRTAIAGGTLNGNTGFLVFNFPEIPFERIRFDCPADAQLSAAQFPCTINQMVNQIGGNVPTDAQPVCKVTLPN